MLVNEAAFVIFCTSNPCRVPCCGPWTKMLMPIDGLPKINDAPKRKKNDVGVMKRNDSDENGMIITVVGSDDPIDAVVLDRRMMMKMIEVGRQ